MMAVVGRHAQKDVIVDDDDAVSNGLMISIINIYIYAFIYLFCISIYEMKPIDQIIYLKIFNYLIIILFFLIMI